MGPPSDEDAAKKGSSQKRKLSDMLGSHWSGEEIIRFYEAYRKYGKDWKKVSATVKNRSSEMVESLYMMNKAYLSLPEGAASKAGLIAMMTDHYNNLARSESEQESNDGAGSSRKSHERSHGKIHPTTSKTIHGKTISTSQTVASSFDCPSLLNKKPGGTRAHPVRKRTPRFPVSFSIDNSKVALAEPSQRGGSPKVSQTPSRRTESFMPSPIKQSQRKYSASEMADTKHLDKYIDEDIEGSTEGDTIELLRHKPSIVEMETVSIGNARQKGRKLEVKKFEIDNSNEDNLEGVIEECSGTEECLRLSDINGKFDREVTGAKISRSSIHSQRKRSKKVLFKRDDEGAAFDALKTLADLSLMMSTENEESTIRFEDEEDDHIRESESLQDFPENQQKEKCRPSVVGIKGYQVVTNIGAASNKKSKHGNVSGYDDGSVPEESQDIHCRKKQKMQTSKIQKTEIHSDVNLIESSGIKARDAGKMLASKIRKTSQSGSPNLKKISKNSSGSVQQKEETDSTQSSMQVPVHNQVNLCTKVKNRRKMNLKIQHAQKDLFHDRISNDQSNPPFTSLHDRALRAKGKLYNCFKNKYLRRWCAYEWLYSAMDSPWFAKMEFVEYLYNVGLGHVPRLTRVEWGVIRSSLGRPRRFSEKFLNGEKEKLNLYRESVRKYYTEIREGIREGLPIDLARPLAVGQRVIAIHPKTREIHDGSVLTIYHSRCRVQFDRHELGVEFVADTECMPLYTFENMPRMLGRQIVGADKFLDNINELKSNERTREVLKLSSRDILDNNDGLSQLVPFVYQSSSFKQTKIVPAETAAHQRIAHSQTQAREADVQVLAELTHALDKKVSSALRRLRQCNAYRTYIPTFPEPSPSYGDPCGALSTYNHSTCQPHGSESHVNEIIDCSKTKARTWLNAAVKALSSLELREDSFDKVEEALDYVTDHFPLDDSGMPVTPGAEVANASDVKAWIPFELITQCLATMLMIQKCTERQSPPKDVDKILNWAVTSLRPSVPQNLAIYNEIRKCMDIIKNQTLARIPTMLQPS